MARRSSRLPAKSGRGRASGAPGNALLYAVFTIRDHKIARYEELYEEQAALGVLD